MDIKPALIRNTAARVEQLAKLFPRGSAADDTLRTAAQNLYRDAAHAEQFPLATLMGFKNNSFKNKRGK